MNCHKISIASESVARLSVNTELITAEVVVSEVHEVSRCATMGNMHSPGPGFVSGKNHPAHTGNQTESTT